MADPAVSPEYDRAMKVAAVGYGAGGTAGLFFVGYGFPMLSAHESQSLGFQDLQVAESALLVGQQDVARESMEDAASHFDEGMAFQESVADSLRRLVLESSIELDDLYAINFKTDLMSQWVGFVTTSGILTLVGLGIAVAQHAVARRMLS